MKQQNVKCVGILASGGDAPGMNACLYYLLKFLEEKKIKYVCFLGGYQGLLDNKKIQITSKDMFSHIDRGGCVIRSGRCEKFMEPKMREKAVENLSKAGCERLIAMGGNGTFNGLRDMIAYKVRSVGIPCTIDNDVFYTEYSIGFDSASNANLQLIENVRAASFAQSKIPIIEVMGRACSKLALRVAVGSGADILVTREMAATAENVASQVEKLLKAGQQDILIISVENYIDIEVLAKAITEKTGRSCKTCINGYAQRGGQASAFDRMLGYKYALEAVKNLNHPEDQIVVGIQGKKTFILNLEKAIEAKTNFNTEIYHNLFEE